MATQGMNPAYLLDPSLYGDQQAIAQQQQLATLLMQEGLTPMGGTQMAGQVALKNSPTQSMAKLAALLSGQSIQKQANQANQAFAQKQAQAMGQMFGMGGWQEGQPMGQMPQGQPQGMPQGQPQQMPQGQSPSMGQPQGGPLSITGMSPQQSLLSYGSDPGKYMESFNKQFDPTDMTKMLRAAGIDPSSPLGRQIGQGAIAKANHVPLEEVKAGNTAIDPYSRQPVAFGVKVPEGAQPSFGPDGRMTSMSMVPGAAGAMTSGTAATGAGSATNDMMTVELPDGTKQNMTRAQAVAWANGADDAPKFNLAPGTDLASARAAIAKGGDRAALDAFDRQYAGKRGMPGFGSGQSTAGREGQMVGAKDVVGRNQAVLADANAAPQDIETLGRMMELTKSAQFGPGASNVAKWKAMAAQFPGMNLVIDPQSLEQQQANVTEMKKYMSNMAGRMSGSSGTGTDARLQNAIDSLPNDAAPNAAIMKVAPMLIAQRTARLDEARIRSAFGNDPGAIQEFETKWRGAYDPMAYEASLGTKGMSPDQAAAFVAKNYTPAQAHAIAKSRAALRALGVQF